MDFWTNLKRSWQSNRLLSEAVKGQFAAHLPETASAVTVGVMFKDKPYAVELGWYQLTNPAITTTIVGALVPLVTNATGMQQKLERWHPGGGNGDSDVAREANRIAQKAIAKYRSKEKKGNK